MQSRPNSPNSMRRDTGKSSSAMDVTDEINVNEENMEKLWARERYEMSQGDREAAYNELHGAESRYNAIEYENPENHYRALIEFDNMLRNNDTGIPSPLKEGYFRALQMK